MASPRRLEKLSNLLKEEIARIIDREVEFPEDAIATITRVEVSPDVHYAAVFLSLLGIKPGDALAVLKKNIYSLQQILNRRVRMRPVPRIKFMIDEGEVKREGVERSLAELKQKGEV